MVYKAGGRLKALGVVECLSCYVASVREVAERLTAADLTSAGLYKLPAVILVRDYLETVRPLDETTTVTGASVLIVADSAADYTSEEREAKVYTPTLWPITDTLLSVCAQAGVLSPTTEIRKIDRQQISGALNEVVLPTTGRALFNDQLDGVELRGLTLSFDCVDTY